MNLALEKTALKSCRKIPDALVYEIMDGQPIYYKRYKSVLNKSKKISDIVGCSSLQAEIVSYFLNLFFIKLDEKTFRVYANRIGLHLDKKNNLSGDICIFKNAILAMDKINTHNYINVPAELQLEIDIKAQLPDIKYISDKTNKLLQFGTKKVIWILTDSRQVMIAEMDKDWIIFNWDKGFETINGINANIGQHLLSNGIIVQ